MWFYIFIVVLLALGLTGGTYSAYKISSVTERTEFNDWGNEYD